MGKVVGRIRRTYECDVCRTRSVWTERHQYYSSIKTEEDYGDNGRVYTCSDECRNLINPEETLRAKIRARC